MARAIHMKSQTDVAKAIGLTFQQMQKYENGLNRISAATLLKVAAYFGESTSYFLEAITDGEVSAVKEQKNLSADMLMVAMKLDRLPPKERSAITSLIHSVDELLKEKLA
jgi:transcriptional regulator with XRE-family HTH domain